MNCLMPRPAEVQTTFWKKYGENPKAATDYFYKLSQDSNYIRRYRVKKDQKWTVDSEYGKLDITINLSKPVLWTVYRTYSDRDYNECCSMKYKTTEQENIL